MALTKTRSGSKLMKTLEPTIGLEVHVQLNTKQKLFSSSATKYGARPNSQTNIVDLGFPGALPVLNQQAVDKAIQFGLAVNANIHQQSQFARKNYFYPDLPKGYQITQHKHPIITDGKLSITTANGTQIIDIERAHLEEDAGKSMHDVYPDHTAIDLNRAGSPLLEIVTKPQLTSSEATLSYLKNLYQLVTYLDICDGNLQEGSFRIDVNISMKPVGSSVLGTRAEIKNVNSFKYVQAAISYEINRQTELLEQGKPVMQETRLFDTKTNSTKAMRSKEDANDYRYFDEPDLPPLRLTADRIAKFAQGLPELPQAKHQRIKQTHNLSDYDTAILVDDLKLADYFEATMQLTKAPAKQVVNWLLSEVLALVNQQEEFIPIPPSNMANLIDNIDNGTISGKIAKVVLAKMWVSEQTADEIITEEQLQQINDATIITGFIEQVFAKDPAKLQAYLAGKDKLFGYFVGQTLKISAGKANPELVNTLLKQLLAAKK